MKRIITFQDLQSRSSSRHQKNRPTADMESTAFLSRPKRSGCTDEPTLGLFQFSAGHKIRIAMGPLTGMPGTLLKQSNDGRWVVQLSDVAPGVLLCVAATHLERQ